MSAAVGIPSPHGLDFILCALTSTERVSLILLSLHGILVGMGRSDLARIAWAAYLDASVSAESLGQSLGVEVTTS